MTKAGRNVEDLHERIQELEAECEWLKETIRKYKFAYIKDVPEFKTILEGE